jgi:type II secretory pathway pseudopilin PulG
MGSTLSGSYDAHDKRQINRATIGEGTIIIRSDPAQGLAGLNRDLKKAQELTKDSKTSVTVYVDPAAIKEAAGGFEGLRKDTGKLLDVIEQILPPELKPQVLSIRWANQELLKAGYSEVEAWRLANEPTVRVWLQTERAGQTLIQKYGSAQNIPEDVRQAYTIEYFRHIKSEGINLSGLITDFTQSGQANSVITMSLVPVLTDEGNALVLLGATTSLAILSQTDWRKVAASAGEAFRNFADQVQQAITEYQENGKLPGYGHTGSKPDTSSPPSTPTPTPVDTLPGGTTDNSGAVGPLSGGSTAGQTPEDYILTTPGVEQKTAIDYIVYSGQNVPPPPGKQLSGYPDAEYIGNINGRATWKNGKERLQWDSETGSVERYSQTGKHIGEFSTEGKQLKGPNPRYKYKGK